ncbi:hypothetical protein M1M27_gp43 [Cellulophaga phage Ingeline_1]|uniref:Uncharacterized protein n=1 Tax=Cellulophaga phage Ingeline_1 TaxID=2745674 RepID=A0A8E4ZL68_9CAUD|nr:hypothetical protein M1M27_gp43 [Cellulophaga phage Ingeline_1]QQV90043.1 hypothetical protein Ingeline2_8 [Cellulophaga phage Ingeline_2]QQV90093.1 hypothetical protein Ingeline3_8 [Cellulophaga phage Ingeline_3]QQV90143.1 hypothetical protein Ingeline4_8 [Cellulophaga phage Ingeline_4]QQV90192.1 hypothetical protein Ingeline5_8 [Cellulophaga phage Ingeline_5]QQV90242.1 hypothetical protein Ingeline6_8 [Cellulophaga phage Ingeline_6]QQV90292.1 hypothetical protein Ingeline7_8 [Cellulophag
MKKWFLQALPLVAALMGFKEDGKEKLNFSAEDIQKLDAETGKEGFAEAFMKYYNEEHLKAEGSANDAYENFMKEFNASAPPVAGATEEEDVKSDAVPEADVKTLSAKLQAVIKKADGLLRTNAQLAADNAKLKDLPEGDIPEATITINPNKNKVKHSATHLFASNNEWDSLDRPWNKAAASNAPLTIKGDTEWNKINIDKLNEDLGAYARRNSNEIMDLLKDGYDIPAHWSVVSNISDQFTFASIVSGQITQAFKKAYLPKNNQRFVPVINKIYDKQIDGEWQASELKSIEKSWLNQFFNEGSTPYKDSFARYLITKLLIQARKEDKISIFKGVYSNPELQPEKAGHFLNSMSGFLKLIDAHRGVDYQPHNLPKLTPSNTYDVITKWCKEQLPIDIRNTPLKLGLGNDVHRWYVDGREASKGLIQDYAKVTGYVEDMPNITFVKHPQLEGSGFIYITTEDNIGLMIDKPGEESLVVIEKAARAIKFFADWKLGIYFKAFGANVDADAVVTYEDQIFFSNSAPVLTDVFVPVAVNDATPSVAEHNALRVGGNNTSATDITNIDDAATGQYVYLYGDSDTNVSTVKNNANLKLDGGDFVLNKGNILVLIKQSGGSLLEYSRMVASEASSIEKVALEADATTANAENGTHFVTVDNTVATALTDIENALAGEMYVIEGGSDTNSTTIANSGKFKLDAAFTASEGAKLTVVYNGAKFIELARV